MGYYLKLKKASFEIPAARAADALAAVADVHGQVYGLSDDDKLTLGRIFGDIAWPLKKMKSGWVMEVQEDSAECKQGWETELFEAVAPFVKDGSYIKARGEDGQDFEWYFARGAVRDSEPLLQLGTIKLTVPVAKLRAAHARVQEKLPRLMEKLDEPVSLTTIFERLDWKTQRAADGSLVLGRKKSEYPELTAPDQRVLKAIAKFVAPDSYVEVLERGEVSRFALADGKLERRS